MNVAEQDFDTFVTKSAAEMTTPDVKSRGELIQHMLAGPTGRQRTQSTLGDSLAEDSLAKEESSDPYHGEAELFQLPAFESRPRFLQSSFTAVQEWEGHVVEVGDDTFTARLMDVTAGVETDREEADFLISDVGESDYDLLVPGAVFRWSIGYVRMGITKIRGSQIVFRRLPKWQAIDVNQGRKRAQELAAAITWK